MKILSISRAVALGLMLLPIGAVAQDTATPDTTPDTTLVAPNAVAIWAEDRTRFFTADEVDLDTLIWEVRPLVVFADSPNDPQFRHQVELLAAGIEDLALRDVMVIIDTDPATPSDIRQKLRPRGFMLALIDKDGRVTFRKPLPWDVREISRSIDKSPLREQEVIDRRTSSP